MRPSSVTVTKPFGFLEAIADPRHPDHDDQLDWHGGPFDPDNLDLDRINKKLNRITTMFAVGD